MWKEAISDFFKDFLQFFFPYIHDDVDWTKNYEILDNELAEITQNSEVGPRRADKLVKIFLLNGTENWLLIHLEVQGYNDPTFAERMHIYNFLIYHKYKRDVESLAVLTDNQKDYRPVSFSRGRWKSKITVEFDVIKLKDYETRLTELQQNSNPFALVVLAHLQAQKLKSRSKSVQLKDVKIQLVKLLLQRGYQREDVIKLLRFIDWLMRLPRSLQEEFKATIRKYGEEVGMPILSSFEMEALEQGRKEGRQEGRQEALLDLSLKMLKQRLGKLTKQTEQQLNSLNLPQLEQLSENLLGLQTTAELENWLQQNKQVG